MDTLGNTFDPRRAALLIVDMQRDFVDPGAPIACVGAPGVVPAIRRLAQSARAAGMPVIYTQEAHRRQKVDFGLELEYGETEHCVEGTPGVEIVDALAPGASDYVLVKRRYSGFFATDLDLLLKGLRVDSLVLTGVATDVCVRATAQDALQLDYRVFVPRECVAGTTAARHDAALEHIGYVLGRVVSLDALLARIARSTGAAHA